MQEAPTLPAVPRVRRAWYVIARSDEVVGATPLRRQLWGQPIVVFRGEDGLVGALLDRCPHRDVPLSAGSVIGNHIQCGYHGWEYDCAGHCKRIPGFLGEPDRRTRRTASFPIREQQDFVWIWADPDSDSASEPFWFEHADAPGYLTVRHEVRALASLHAVAENALDVPHTSILHKGLFRNDAQRTRIVAKVERHSDRVSCEFVGEPRPPGWVARILSPTGGIVTHFDRFFLPSVVQVEYRLGDENHVVSSAALTPVDDYMTQLHAVICVRTRMPRRLLRPILQPLALRIFDQDAKLLALQTESIRRFGHQKYLSTDIDLLGPHILRLLWRASRGDDLAEREPFRAEVELDV